ncbi:MAG: sigma-70 region 4 domain-containing protein [Acidimicrobiia bacterium]
MGSDLSNARRDDPRSRPREGGGRRRDGTGLRQLAASERESEPVRVGVPSVVQLGRRPDQAKRSGAEAVSGRGQFIHVDPGYPATGPHRRVNRLSLEQRAVVVLRVVNDWSERDVAAALGIPVGTVKSRLSRALEILRLEVENDD